VIQFFYYSAAWFHWLLNIVVILQWGMKRLAKELKLLSKFIIHTFYVNFWCFSWFIFVFFVGNLHKALKATSAETHVANRLPAAKQTVHSTSVEVIGTGTVPAGWLVLWSAYQAFVQPTKLSALQRGVCQSHVAICSRNFPVLDIARSAVLFWTLHTLRCLLRSQCFQNSAWMVQTNVTTT